VIETGIPGIKTAQYCAGPDLLYYNGFDISDTELMYGHQMCRGCHAAEATTFSLEDERRIRQGALRPAASSYPQLIAVRRRSHEFCRSQRGLQYCEGEEEKRWIAVKSEVFVVSRFGKER
jgi:hypothetical protein